MPFPLLAVGLGLAAASAAAGAAQAASANRAINASRESLSVAAGTAKTQTRAQARLERFKERRRAAIIEGSVRARAGSQGSDADGSFGDMLGTNAFESGLNTLTVTQNERNRTRRIQSGFLANDASLSQQVQSPLLAAFAGGVQGLSTGLAIGEFADSVKENRAQ